MPQPRLKSGKAIPGFHVFMLTAIFFFHRAIVEQVFAEYILPLPSQPSSSSSSTKPADVDEVAWTDRLLFTMRFLDEQAINVLVGISGIKLG